MLPDALQNIDEVIVGDSGRLRGRMVIERGEFSANTVRLTVRWAGDIVADSEKGRLNFLFASRLKLLARDF